MPNDMNSLSHTKWNCKYHIVFAPKYRRKIIYGELKEEVGKILRQLCDWKEIKIIEAELCPRSHSLDERVKFHGISKREEQFDDSRTAWKFEVQVRKPQFLVPGILQWTPQGKMQKRSKNTILFCRYIVNI